MVRRNGTSFLLTGLAVTLLATLPSDACIICAGENGQKVREGIFSADFAASLFAVLAPAPVLLVAALLLSNFLGSEKRTHE
jgi:hypothetical protein